MIKTAVSFTLGCVLFLHLSIMPSTQWFWAIIPACILLLLPHTRWLASLMLGAIWTLFYVNLIINDRLPSSLTGQDIVILGTIASVPEHQNRRIRFLFTPDKSSHKQLPDMLRLNWYQPLPEHLNSGDRWQLTVRLKQPHGMMNPGSFDYESWLFQQGIGATGYVRSNPTNKFLAAAPFYSINVLRQKLATTIKVHLDDSKNLGLIQALVTGIRHNIDPQQWQILRWSGTSHLLAISGLHIGLAATLGFLCFRWLWSRRANNLLLLPAREAGAIGGFILALFYAALAGFSIPTQRALIMVTTVMVLVLIRRPTTTSHILALSLILVLLFDPLSVLSAGFWLSFSAVSIILFISQNRFPSPHWQWAKIHTLIAFGLTPLLLLFFMQSSVVAPIANFIAVPVISLLVVPILLLASCLLWLWQPAGILLFQLADMILTLLWPLLDCLASLPFSHWTSIHLPTLYWIPIIIGTAVLLLPRGSPGKWLGILGLTPLLFITADKPDKNEFWFTLLDVGQGLAAVIQTQQHTIVFDTGPKFSADFNTGEAVILPFLRQQGIPHIDTLIVSHGDNDHIGGAQSLIEGIQINHILSSTPELLPQATPCLAGQSWQWDGVTFSILHPNIKDSGSSNNLSCVLKIATESVSVLIPGDIEHSAEQLLINHYGENLASTVLVAPHHGSKTSSSRLFINMVDPEAVLFPTGYNNRYHFPHHSVTKRYQDKGIRQFNTAADGAIQFKSVNFNVLSITAERQTSKKIWTHQPSLNN